MTEDPDVLMKRTAEAYASCNSYQDSGYVETVYHPGTEKERTSRLTFLTYFRRPHFFRYEWTDRFFEDSQDRHHIIWSNGKAAYEKEPGENSKRVTMPLSIFNLGADISLAIAGASGAAHTVPTLLMPEVGGLKYTESKDLVYVGEEILDEDSCHKIRVNDVSDYQIHLWIYPAENL